MVKATNYRAGRIKTADVASIGAAVVSSVAAASLVGDTLTGFTNGFIAIAAAAGGGALVAALLTPGRPARATE
jgi:putative N-acetylmannosamine-6-phosphate epimerase